MLLKPSDMRSKPSLNTMRSVVQRPVQTGSVGVQTDSFVLVIFLFFCSLSVFFTQLRATTVPQNPSELHLKESQKGLDALCNYPPYKHRPFLVYLCIHVGMLHVWVRVDNAWPCWEE